MKFKDAKDREEDKSDFDGTPPPAQENSDETNPGSDSTVSSEQKKEYSNPRTSYGKKTIVADKVVVHYCSQEAIPAGAHVLEERVHIVYEYKMEVIEHRYISYRVVENGGTPYEVPYVSNDPLDTFGSKACMIEGCPADVSLLAMILTNKYQFHLPVQRQVEMLASYGLKISKSTLNHWLHKAIKQLRPLEDAIKTQLLEAGSYLFCDETSELVCVKDAKTGEMHYRKKYVWGIVNTVKKLVYYLYEEGSRARKVIGNFLSGSRLQAHQVKELRKEKSGSTLGDLYSQIESLYHDKLTRYSDLLRKAINYAYHEWKAVVRYIENVNWSIDNNEGKRRMKPVVLERKNYTNYGSHQGASNGAYMYTLVESCKMSGSSPVAYIRDVLHSLIKGETDNLQLIPCNWVNNK
nr:transposase [uncultured Macellibacteroides sp.]